MKPRIAGVYFLFKDNNLVYIGETKDIYRRIAEHTAGKKCNGVLKSSFDRWEFIEIENNASRKRAEEMLITMLQPEWNIAYLGGCTIEPHTKEQAPEEIKPVYSFGDHPLPMLDPLVFITPNELGDIFGLPSKVFFQYAKTHKGEDCCKYFASVPFFRRQWVDENRKIFEVAKVVSSIDG